MVCKNAFPASVHAVIVTYRPDVTALQALLSALAPQVGHITIVDNTDAKDTCVETVIADSPCTAQSLIRLGSNQGIARALNIGISTALDAGARYVLLSDQDSLPAPDMVGKLLRVLSELRAGGVRVGGVGPTYTDRHTHITYPFQAIVPGKFFYGHVRADADHPIVEALTLITSGTLIPAEILRDAGYMREDFFIDHVDIEWCHRARAAGYRLFGVGGAVMYHAMGEHALRVWYLGWRQESAYSPLRVYYRVRNFIALCRLPTMRTRWKVRNGWYCIGVVYTQVVFGDERRKTFAMALRGLCDGVRGRMGPWRS